jgi:hypothetical protein
LESELLGLAGHIAAAQCRFVQRLAEWRWAPAAEVEQTLLKVALAGTASRLETVVCTPCPS